MRNRIDAFNTDALDLALEELEEPSLVVARRVEHEVVHAVAHVLRDLGDHLVGVVADDPALGDRNESLGLGRRLEQVELVGHDPAG